MDFCCWSLIPISSLCFSIHFFLHFFVYFIIFVSLSSSVEVGTEMLKKKAGGGDLMGTATERPRR